jgi:hypothetical protein
VTRSARPPAIVLFRGGDFRLRNLLESFRQDPRVVTLGSLAERYWGTVGTGASGWDARAERSMAMAAYAMTKVTAQRISVR